jgi:hypothetical protein
MNDTLRVGERDRALVDTDSGDAFAFAEGTVDNSLDLGWEGYESAIEALWALGQAQPGYDDATAEHWFAAEAHLPDVEDILSTIRDSFVFDLG